MTTQVDRSTWWVALDGQNEVTIWRLVNGYPWSLHRKWNSDPEVWAYLTEGLPDRGDCEDCTAIPCRAHDNAGVTIPQENL